MISQLTYGILYTDEEIKKSGILEHLKEIGTVYNFTDFGFMLIPRVNDLFNDLIFEELYKVFIIDDKKYKYMLWSNLDEHTNYQCANDNVIIINSYHITAAFQRVGVTFIDFCKTYNLPYKSPEWLMYNDIVMDEVE